MKGKFFPIIFILLLLFLITPKISRAQEEAQGTCQDASGQCDCYCPPNSSVTVPCGAWPGCIGTSCTCMTYLHSEGVIDWNSLFGAIQPNLPPNSPIDFRNLTIGGVISNVLPYVFAIAGFLLLIYLVIGGYQYLLSQNDPKKTAQARDHITWAIVGFIVVISAYFITQIISRVLAIPESSF